MEVDKKVENVSHKTETYNPKKLGDKLEAILLQSLLKNNNKPSNNQSFLSSPLNTSQLSWPVDPQMCDNNVHVEPLEDLEGSSILSEFESYYTAKSDLSVSNNQINIPKSSGNDSSITSILDLDNSDEVTNIEDRLMQKKNDFISKF